MYFIPVNGAVKVCYLDACLYIQVCVCVRVSTLLTGDVVLCRWLPIQPIKICMSVCL